MDFSQNFFELFGLDRGFEIDSEALTSRYRKLQKTLHPDRYANASDQERRLSLQQAAQVNAGFQTLKDPLLRARYLLTLYGVEDVGETSTIKDVEFLEEQMELRETLAEIRHDRDPVDALIEFMAQLDAKVKDYIETLRTVFSHGDEVDVEKAHGVVQRMQFVRRLQQEAESLEEELI